MRQISRPAQAMLCAFICLLISVSTAPGKICRKTCTSPTDCVDSCDADPAPQAPAREPRGRGSGSGIIGRDDPNINCPWFGGSCRPKDGFTWYNNDPRDFRTVPLPDGTPYHNHPNVVWDGNGHPRPTPGYRWRSSNRADDEFRVLPWPLGTAHPLYPHVVWSGKGNSFRPAEGYEWSSNDPASDGFRVVPVAEDTPHAHYPHVVWDGAGKLRPMDGYDWKSSTGREVVPLPAGTPDARYPHVIWDGEGNPRPARGYRWEFSLPRGDRSWGKPVGSARMRYAVVPVDNPSPEPIPLRMTKSWNGLLRQDQKEELEDIITAIPDGDDPGQHLGRQFKRWVSKNVEFERVSRRGGPPLGVVPGRLNVNDSFWPPGQKETGADERRENVLVFELGKTVWHGINGADTKVAKTPLAKAFVALTEKYPAAFGAMRSSGWKGITLSDGQDRSQDRREGFLIPSLADEADLQSRFAYAVRVAVLELYAPSGASAELKREWPKARQAMGDFLTRYFNAGH